MQVYLAVDIGASSGRHVLGWVENGLIKTEEIYRFENGFAPDENGTMCWDIDALFSHVVEGMRVAGEMGRVPAAVGIDTWAVDFVLLDKDGKRLTPAVAYRDSRTDGMDKWVEERISFEELYGITGIQKQPFNTIYQLAALKKNDPELLERANHLLMVPDYLHFLLSGVMTNEYTNATTTALLNCATNSWDATIMDKLGLPRRLFGQLGMPGTCLGTLTTEMQQRVGYNCRVVLPATHDTGSAYLAVPAPEGNPATLSSGTWSLLGIESKTPIVTDAAREANFTNEGGYDYRYRFLKNIMGLWMVQSIRRENGKLPFSELEEMARASSFEGVVDANSAAFLAPENMTEAVKKGCVEAGGPAPETLGDVMRCVYQSLALCYRDAVAGLEAITGQKISAVNIVGGGSKDGYLNELTAKATGLPVFAGPTEGTVIGNLMVQMIADGEFEDLAAARAAVRNSFTIKEYV